jgi:RNA polymerase sigma-70 factor (ECF subfamily)
VDDDAVREGELRPSRERLERLYAQVQPGLVRYLRAFAPAYAEDIASVAWTEVLTALPRFNGTDDEFRRWLFVTARRRVIDHHRRGWRRLVVLREPEHTDLSGRGSDDPAFEESAASEAVTAILASLPRDQAEIVLLRVIGGFSAAEVALITDRPAATVRVLQHRALRRLARELGEGGETT